MYWLSWQLSSKEPTCLYRRCKFNHWAGKIPQRRKWQSHSSILAWEIPSTEKSDGLQSMGLPRVRHDLALNNNCIYRKLLGNFSLERKVKSLSCVQLFATPLTVACQAPLSMGFSRQEYWSGLPFPSSVDFPDPGIEPGSVALQADTFPSEPPGKPLEFDSIQEFMK